jgi:hypothetical protein
MNKDFVGEDSPGSKWRIHYTFGLLVTGDAEKAVIVDFLRSLTTEFNCHFEVIRLIDQLTPVTSEKKKLKKKKLEMVGTGKAIPSKDVEQIYLKARGFLRDNSNSFVILLDDLERRRREIHKEVFDRYRAVLDMLDEDLRRRTSVHFLVNMLEAYYLAHADAVNEALGTKLEDHKGDVEEIPNPKDVLKENLKAMKSGFNEIADGKKIVPLLKMDHVLGNPDTCASLRTLFKWCILAGRGDVTDRFQLLSGVYSPITSPQLAALEMRSGQS